MCLPAALVLLDSKANRHSLNALVGALESDRALDGLGLRLPANEARLTQCIEELLCAGTRPVVGVSFATLQAPRVRQLMLRRVRTAPPGREQLAPLWIAGGPHPTAAPEETLRMGFNAVVLGEGEATLLDLLRQVAAAGDWTDVPGLAVHGPGGAIRSTEPRTPIELDAFPPFPLVRRRVVGPIEISRGCPFACAYCQTSHLLGRQPRHRSVETIARFAGVIRRRGLRDVRVVAPDAFSYGSPDGRSLNLDALESLLASLRRTLESEGRLFFGTFPSEVRPEHVQDETLALLKRFANNDSVIIGAQSGSDRTLRRCGRAHTVADVFSAVSRTLAAGLKPHVDFIFGLPGETEEDLKSTINAIRELAAMGGMIHAHTFMPLPQTGLAAEPPGKISGRLRPVLKELIRRGSLYGIWHKQGAEGLGQGSAGQGHPRSNPGAVSQ